MIETQDTSPTSTSVRLASPQPTTTGTSAPARPGGGRFEELEAYRGIAALLVVVFHAYQYSREGTGRPNEVYEGTPWHALFHNLEAAVAWFFALSGFLIFLPFARAALAGRAGQSPRDFLIRRALRLLPPYYLAILLVWSRRYTGGAEQWRDLLQHLTFTHIFDRTHIFWTIGPAWSLAVEVIFYLFLAVAGPLSYRLCGRLATRWVRVLTLVAPTALLLAGSLAYKWWAFWLAGIPRIDFPVYFGPAAIFDTFALGMLLAIVVAACDGRPLFAGIVPSVLRLAGIVLIAVTFLLRATHENLNLYFQTLSGVAFVLVLASTTLGPRRSLWGRALTHPALQFLGLVSYGVYLWHEPLLIDLGSRGLLIRQVPTLFPLNALFLVALSIGVATLSYYGLERPAAELRHLFTREGRLSEGHPTASRGHAGD